MTKLDEYSIFVKEEKIVKKGGREMEKMAMNMMMTMCMQDMMTRMNGMMTMMECMKSEDMMACMDMDMMMNNMQQCDEMMTRMMNMMTEAKQMSM